MFLNQNVSHEIGQEKAKKRSRRRQLPVIRRTLGQPDSVAIRHLSRYSMLKIEQIQRSMKCSERTVKRALAGLREANLITEGYLLPDRDDEPTKPTKVISLNSDGVSFVEHFECSWALFDRKPIARDWKNKFIQDPEIRHKLGMVDCMIGFCDFIDQIKSLEVSHLVPDFLDDDEGKSANKTVHKGGALIPDIIASVFNRNLGTSREFFIEYDRGTEPVWMGAEARIKAKKKYEKHRKKGKGRLSIPICDRFANYNTYFGENSNKTSDTNPSILWVCETETALRRIGTSERIDWLKMSNIIDRTFFATIDEVKGDFLGTHWHRPDSDEIVSPAGGSS